MSRTRGSVSCRVVEERHDSRGARVPDDVELTGAAVGELDGVLFEPDDAALVNEFGCA